MNKKRYLFATLMLSLLSINKAYAICSQEELNEFKKVEDGYKVTYEFNRETKDYKLTIYNPLPNKYAYSFNKDLGHIKYESGDENKITFSGIKSGKYKATIIGSKECQSGLKEITFEIPEYNKYYDDPLCEGIEEFVLCQPTYDKEIDYDTFSSRVETYKRTKLKKEEVTEEKEENEMINYIKENFYSIIIIVVFIILVIITAIITIKSIKKSRRLE